MLKAQHAKMTILLIVVLSTTCKQSATEPAAEENLIPNGNFETDHTPTLQGWLFGNPQLAKLVNQAPPDGGTWALELSADWAPTMGFAYTPISTVQSGDILELSAYVRAIGQDGGGSIELRTGQSIWTGTQAAVETSDTSWKQLSVIDTVALNPTDTLWVVLSSFHTEIVPRRGLFDLITLKRINSR